MKSLKWIKFLRSPWSIAAGVGIGIIIGIFFKDLSNTLFPFGELYIRFLEMCILPIIITAVISSIGKLLKSKSSLGHIKALIFLIVGGLFVASLLGISFASIGRPGKGLNLRSKIELGRIISSYQSGKLFEIVPEKIITAKTMPEEKKESLFTFITKLIPSNIFGALSQGDNIKVLFFAIIFGIAIGFIPDEYGNALLPNISGLFYALEEIIFFALYALPFALICLISHQIAETGSTILIILTRYVILYFSIITGMFIINLILMAIILKKGFFESLKALKEAILIALGSANVYVAMPSALKGLYEHLKLDKNSVKLIFPIGISIFAFGSTCFYAFNTLFFAQLFDIHLGLQEYLIISLGAILASMGTVGAPVLIKITMLSIIFTPIGIPVAPAIAILTAIKPITESFEEVWDMHCNCLLTIFLSKPQASTDAEATK